MEPVFAVSAASWGVLMALAPVLQIRRIIRERSSRDVSIAYYLVLLVGFALWVLYGVSSTSWALIVPNAVAFVVCTATIGVARRYRPSDEQPDAPGDASPS